jgi:hypothetical protein
MAVTVWGVVNEGRVIPEEPLPEGLHVQIVIPDAPPEMPPEVQEELDMWARARANALKLVERLAEEEERREEG